MITNESIMKAELIEFTYDLNNNLVERKDKQINTAIVVIQDNYIVDIDTFKNYELYTLDTDIVPGKKYIYKLYSPGNVDLELYTKALIAFNNFIDKKFKNSDQNKILEFKPKNNRDN